ncbi:MAG: alpha/beta hydrolase family protein [Vulcanimicrobiaceae bacterium]
MANRPAVLATALALCAALAAAAAAGPAPSATSKPVEAPASPGVATIPEPAAPPDGTYLFALARNGTDQGTTTVILTRRAGQNLIESDEVGVVGAARARILGAYRYRDLGAEAYVATYQAPFLRTEPLGHEGSARPHVPFDSQTTVRYHLDAGVARATLDAVDGVFMHPISASDSPSPLPSGVRLPRLPWILDGPFMTGYLMLPAYRHLSNEIAVAPVSQAFPPDPALTVERVVRAHAGPKTPSSDVALELPGIATVWYDPHSLVVHEVYLEGYNLDARLVSYTSRGGELPNLASAPETTPAPELPSQPISFTSQDGTRLSGARSAPAPTKEAPPAVLLIPPPVPEPATRDYSENGPDPMFPALARALVQRGYLVLRYDGRGAGRSAGAFDQMTWEQSLADAQAALSALVSSGGIDAKHVYLLGYGYGADLALAAADGNRYVAGVIALGPSVVSYHEAAARRHAAHLASPPQTTLFVDGRTIAPNNSAWQRSSFGHDPVALATRTRVPLFVLHSGVVSPVRMPNDVQSYDDRLRAANPRATVVVAGDLSERFGGRYDADSRQNSEAIFPYRFDPSTEGAIADWLDEVRATGGVVSASARSSHAPIPPAPMRRPPPPPPGNTPILSKPIARPTVLPGQLIVPGANTIPMPTPTPSPASH